MRFHALCTARRVDFRFIRMRFTDFERLVRPRVHPFSLARGEVRGRS